MPNGAASRLSIGSGTTEHITIAGRVGRGCASTNAARTTLAKIAAAAGVSVETVQGQGTKAALLIAAAEFAGVGVSGEESIFALEVGRQMIASGDLQETVDLIAKAVTEIHEATAKLAPALFGGAHADAELDRYLSEFIAGINGQVRRVLTVFRDRGWLRGDVPFEELVETAAVLCSVETYIRMVHRDGWSVPAYQSWCRRMLAETVFVGGQVSN